MLARLALNVICAHYRYDGKQHGCAKHGACHSTIWQESCADFQGVKRARQVSGAPLQHVVRIKPAKSPVQDDFTEHCPCAAKK